MRKIKGLLVVVAIMVFSTSAHAGEIPDPEGNKDDDSVLLECLTLYNEKMRKCLIQLGRDIRECQSDLELCGSSFEFYWGIILTLPRSHAECEADYHNCLDFAQETMRGCRKNAERALADCLDRLEPSIPESMQRIDAASDI